MNKLRKERIERRKKLKAWSKAVRARDNNQCQICYSTKFLNAHHILPKELKEHSIELRNGITLCCGCHKYSNYSAHKNGFWFSAWLQRYKPVHYNYCIGQFVEAKS